jgi:hypothetical protein
MGGNLSVENESFKYEFEHFFEFYEDVRDLKIYKHSQKEMYVSVKTKYFHSHEDLE